MTMLIAGHETTAAVLTWAAFMLAQVPLRLQTSAVSFSHLPAFLAGCLFMPISAGGGQLGFIFCCFLINDMVLH